ncbi:hypothetical protein AVEN_181232-1 [Araneus ventricosus]|uniref:Uncharacterized protein n=1 Tax=Araneus ventricosus TaxID=182803 RepID=A0A4Y2WGK1_ARAVE|nr:hypothetical protein AVEN_181232-1 [Araneus ventricosus]
MATCRHCGGTDFYDNLRMPPLWRHRSQRVKNCSSRQLMTGILWCSQWSSESKWHRGLDRKGISGFAGESNDQCPRASTGWGPRHKEAQAWVICVTETTPREDWVSRGDASSGQEGIIRYLTRIVITFSFLFCNSLFSGYEGKGFSSFRKRRRVPDRVCSGCLPIRAKDPHYLLKLFQKLIFSLSLIWLVFHNEDFDEQRKMGKRRKKAENESIKAILDGSVVRAFSVNQGAIPLSKSL